MRLRGIHLLIVGIMLSLFGVALISCSPDKTAPTLEASIRPTTEADTVAPVSVALAGGTPIPEIPPFTDTECLVCHSDQARLTELAVEEEDIAHSLSSGPG